jgi:endoglucanase
VTWGTPADREQLSKDFAKVAAWSLKHHRPIHLGEFGAYDRSGTPLAMRVAYTDAVAREAKRHGFGWSYWQFDSDFIAWDMKRNRWFEPIRNALIPKR